MELFTYASGLELVLDCYDTLLELALMFVESFLIKLVLTIWELLLLFTLLIDELFKSLQ